MRAARALLAGAAVAVVSLAAVGCQSVTATSDQTYIPWTAARGSPPDTETSPVPHSSSPPGRRTSASSSASSGGSSPRNARRSLSTSNLSRFELLVSTAHAIIHAPVAPLPAVVHASGSADPIDPPHDTAQDWLTVAWITQSAYPSAPSAGTSYIYGHACHYHVCAFTMLTAARVGDGITVTTSSRELSYQVCAIGVSPKSGNLIVPRCANTAPDLVLVTCEYEQGDTSTSNIVVAARLTAANARQS